MFESKKGYFVLEKPSRKELKRAMKFISKELGLKYVKHFKKDSYSDSKIRIPTDVAIYVIRGKVDWTWIGYTTLEMNRHIVSLGLFIDFHYNCPAKSAPSYPLPKKLDIAIGDILYDSEEVNNILGTTGQSRVNRIVASDSEIKKFDKRIGSRITSLREASGLTQKEVGLLVGISPSLVSMHESGYQRMVVSSLLKYATLYMVEPSLLIPPIFD